MRIPRIFSSTPLQTKGIVDLDSRATNHLKDVLRLKAGYKVVLFDGDGHDYAGEILRLEKKFTQIEIHSQIKVTNESTLSIHLLQPVSRAEKMDWCIQKATELGVHKITPTICARSNVKYDDKKIEKKLVHWQSVITSACEQSGRATVPLINAPLPYKEVISKSDDISSIKIITSPSANSTLSSIENKNVNHCVCSVGPEGGFTEDEISLAKNQGYCAISLGPRVLRLETAVIGTLAILQAQWGDLGQQVN